MTARTAVESCEPDSGSQRTLHRARTHKTHKTHGHRHRPQVMEREVSKAKHDVWVNAVACDHKNKQTNKQTRSSSHLRNAWHRVADVAELQPIAGSNPG